MEPLFWLLNLERLNRKQRTDNRPIKVASAEKGRHHSPKKNKVTLVIQATELQETEIPSTVYAISPQSTLLQRRRRRRSRCWRGSIRPMPKAHIFIPEKETVSKHFGNLRLWTICGGESLLSLCNQEIKKRRTTARRGITTWTGMLFFPR